MSKLITSKGNSGRLQITLRCAAIFAIAKSINSLSFCQKSVLVGVTLIALVFGVVALVIVQHDLGQARQRINNIEKGIFSSAEQSLLDIQDDTKAFTRGWFFHLLSPVFYSQVPL